jgi:uncharacterized membrane protein
LSQPQDEQFEALSNALARMVRRQDDIDRRLARIEAALNLQPAAPPAPPPPPPVPAPQFAAPPPLPPPLPVSPLPAAPPPLPPEREHERLETNIGLTLINRIGVITLVLGVGFFFKWAVDNQYIGPAGRVELGILAGLLTLFAGDLLWNRGQKIFAQGVTGTGVCILYLAIYAAFGFYHLVPQTFAFLLMVVVTLMAAALALRYDAVAIAALGMFGGYLTPILLSSGVDHPWFLFTYILLLDLGALALARVRPWALLNILSFIATVLLYAGWLSDRFTTAKETVATVFDLVYYAFFSYALSLPALLFAQVLASIAMVAIWPRDPAEYFLFSLFIALGGLVLADVRKAAPLVATTFATTWICFAMWNAEFTTTRPLGPHFIGLTCTFAIFLAWILWWTVWRRQPARGPELVILALNGIAYFGASYGLLNPEYHAWLGLFAVAVAGIHLGLAFLIWKNEGAADLNAVVLSLAFALTYITLAIPIQFTAYRITMAWAIEAAALTWIGKRLNQERMHWGALAVFWLAAIRLITLDAWILPNPETYTALWNGRFLTFFVSAVALWIAAYWGRQRPTAFIYYIAGHVVIIAGLTMEVLGAAARESVAANLESVESVGVSILWALYALVLVGFGVALRFVLNRILGLILLGIVVVKLYIWDVWQLARVFRITSFVALGVLLLATSYLYSRYRTKIESWWKDDEPPSS